jgi:putative membrane protein
LKRISFPCIKTFKEQYYGSFRKKKINLPTIFFAVLIWSGINPHDYYTWLLEVSPALIGLAILAATYKRFQLTELTYWLILIHCIILMVGGHYTYARVPLFNWIRDTFELSRNHYDKVGHFAQGFIPAVIIREILIRKSPVTSGKWLFFIVVSICLALSAFYEFIEWWVAVLSGTAAEAFLGTQGYVWDTQSDMFLALLGSIISLIVFGKLHDRLLLEVPTKR